MIHWRFHRKARAMSQQLEGDEDLDVEDKPFKESLGALVKNCNMLHNIVGPACIFLKQGFARTLVCNRKSQKCAHCVLPQPKCNFFHLCRFIFIPTSWLTLLLFTSCVIPPCISGSGQTIKIPRQRASLKGSITERSLENH